MNVVYFPVARRIDGRVWHGGRGFKSEKALIDTLSDKDWRRVVDWERKNAAWLASQRRQAARRRRMTLEQRILDALADGNHAVFMGLLSGYFGEDAKVSTRRPAPPPHFNQRKLDESLFASAKTQDRRSIYRSL